MAVSSCVAISNLTSVVVAADKLIVKVKILNPLLSVAVTSLMLSVGTAPGVQLFRSGVVLRGTGACVKKSAAFTFLSVQPPATQQDGNYIAGGDRWSLLTFGDSSLMISAVTSNI